MKISDEVGLQIVQNDPLVVILPTGRKITLHCGQTAEELTNELISYFPDEADGIHKFMQIILPLSQDVGELLSQGTNVDFSDSKYKSLKENLFKTGEEIFDECNLSKNVRAVIEGQYGFVTNVSQDIVPILCLPTFFMLMDNASYIKGGSQTLTNAAVNRFKKQGGELLLDTEVTKIIVEKNQVKGVVTDKGKTFSSDYVLTNLVQTSVYADLIGEENTPKEVLDNLNKTEPGYGAMNLYLGLDCSPEEIGITAPRTFAYYNDNTNLYNIREQSKTFNVPDQLMFSSHNALIQDGSFSPKGTTELSVFTVQDAAQWINLDPSEYFAKKEEYMKALIDRTEITFPGIKDHIEECDLATPITLMRYNHEPNGTFFGLNPGVKTLMASSPALADSPINGLYTINQQGYQGSYQNGNDLGELISSKLDQNRQEAKQ